MTWIGKACCSHVDWFVCRTVRMTRSKQLRQMFMCPLTLLCRVGHEIVSFAVRNSLKWPQVTNACTRNWRRAKSAGRHLMCEAQSVGSTSVLWIWSDLKPSSGSASVSSMNKCTGYLNQITTPKILDNCTLWTVGQTLNIIVQVV